MCKPSVWNIGLRAYTTWLPANDALQQRSPRVYPVHMRWLFLLLLVCCGIAAGQGGVEIAGVRFDERARVGPAEAKLNGAGVRSILGVKLYAIGVYLPQPADSLAEALRATGPKRIQIVPKLDLYAEVVTVGLTKAVRRNLGDSEFIALQERIEMLHAAVQAAGRAPAGSLLQFDWLPDAGVTRLSLDGLQRGADIPGEDLFHALLKVWLGDKVNDERLRDALLGRTSSRAN